MVLGSLLGTLLYDGEKWYLVTLKYLPYLIISAAASADR